MQESLIGVATRTRLLLLNRPFTVQVGRINKVGPLITRKPSLLFHHDIPLLVHLALALELVIFLRGEMYQNRAAKKKYSLVSKHSSVSRPKLGAADKADLSLSH